MVGQHTATFTSYCLHAGTYAKVSASVSGEELGSHQCLNLLRGFPVVPLVHLGLIPAWLKRELNRTKQKEKRKNEKKTLTDTFFQLAQGAVSAPPTVWTPPDCYACTHLRGKWQNKLLSFEIGACMPVCLCTCIQVYLCVCVCVFDLDILLIHWRRRTWPDSRRAKEHDWRCSLHVCLSECLCFTGSAQAWDAVHDSVWYFACVCLTCLQARIRLPAPLITQLKCLKCGTTKNPNKSPRFNITDCMFDTFTASTLFAIIHLQTAYFVMASEC